jgi:uncharacterized membrane protein YecN with MAPEG domain
VPLALGLLGLLEWSGAGAWLTYGAGIALLAARVAHAYGLYASVFPARVVGTTLTWIVIAALALVVLGRIA